ncbi:MAG TPA: hypothetical protein VKQ30_01630 [Ktedonobacterales bacterium]|nr:hypothetical protein [Ktedonobacterales bacterium]
MGILDTLFGRQKPVPIGPERLFAMSTAQITLETEQNLTPAGEAAMCFKGVASGPFNQIQGELDQLLKVAGKGDNVATYRSTKDDLGYTWLIFASTDFQTLVTTMHVASRTLLDEGYGSQLLFAIFSFKTERGGIMYWMYNYKRGSFYPFVPQTDSHDKLRRRDNSEELRLAAALNKELPVEQETERWFPVWDLPL